MTNDLHVALRGKTRIVFSSASSDLAWISLLKIPFLKTEPGIQTLIQQQTMTFIEPSTIMQRNCNLKLALLPFFGHGAQWVFPISSDIHWHAFKSIRDIRELNNVKSYYLATARGIHRFSSAILSELLSLRSAVVFPDIVSNNVYAIVFSLEKEMCES